MPSPSSLHLALDLAQSPILAAVMRRQPVPEDALMLVRLAGGDEEVLQKAVRRTGRESAQLRAAATFYIQQVLWQPDADHYRVLGASSDADAQTLAEHMRFFMKWLHPDGQAAKPSSRSLGRVLEAWEAVKTPERRRRYDRALLLRQGRPIGESTQSRGMRHLPVIHDANIPSRTRMKMAVFWSAALASAALVAVVVIAPDWLPVLAR